MPIEFHRDMAVRRSINHLTGAYQTRTLLIRLHAIGKPQGDEFSKFFNGRYIIGRDCDSLGYLNPALRRPFTI